MGDRWKSLNLGCCSPEVLKTYHIHSRPAVYVIGADQRIENASHDYSLEKLLPQLIERLPR
jgi:hypothetical protein